MGSPRPKVISSQTVTRPADTTAYTDKDLVANNTSAGSVTPFLFEGVVRAIGYSTKILRAAVKLSGTALTNGSFRLHLFSAAPTVGAGDNSALAVATNTARYLGYLDIVASIAGTGGVKGWSVAAMGNSPVLVSVDSTSLWGLLEAKAAYTPASGETIVCSLEVERS